MSCARLPNYQITQFRNVVLGTFNFRAVSVMLERYDTPGCSRVRCGKIPKTQEANHFGNRGPGDRPGPGLVVSVLAGGADCRPLLRRPAEAGLQNGLRHL